MKKLTIKEIAELTGVSTATVSKVLNNTGRYSEETRKKILDVVQEYDYRPNAVAKSLRTRRSKTIGVIVPDITNEFFAQIVLAIEKYCGPKGYSVFICNTDENGEKELQYIKELELKGVDGLIHLIGSDELFNVETNLPVVCIDRKPMAHNAAFITSDNFQGGYLAASELIEKGCKKILLIRDYRVGHPTLERQKGFKSALKEKKIPFNEEEQVLNVEVGIEQGKKAVQELIKNGNFDFDGVFATTDWLAFGAKLALEENGIKIPEEVKIIGFDNINLAKYSSVSSIHQDKEAMGQKAAENLINRIELNIHTNDVIKLPVTLVSRNSTSV
ncbi:LacI family DNA-binding transcriptional regulator [Mesobacillus sp. S13]|uniref:LacI family DNA-binding transcriptional regulator n=1 Tax=Mesobacillus sp. S13 TaxID=2880221 RepID=UPI001CF287E2|nr:LacI family DNA-binding transcriptional regulator [Mesobacillus sp. S13]